MKFSNEAIHAVDVSSRQSENVEENPSPSPAKNDNDNSLPEMPIELSPLYKVLKGYSLYKQDVKLEAIVTVLRLSSFAPILKSHDISILAELEIICETPKKVLNSMKGPCKMPSKWTSKFCSKFIIEVVELIE